MIFYLATPEFYGISLGSPARVKCHKMAITKFHGTKWYFIWRYQSSMEFHGTKWYVIWRHQSSMEYSMELIDISFGGTRVPWNSRDYSMDPWNTCVICYGALQIPWNPMELGWFFIWPLYRVPRNSMVYPMEVQGSMTLNKKTIWKFHGIPWN